MVEFDDCKSKISIWWDIENCPVPRGVNAHFIAQNLSIALRHADFSGPIEINVFGDTTMIEHNTQKALSDTGISLNHVPRGNKDAADKAILVAMLFWALENPPPAHFLLISGDVDFANALHRLRLKRYSISLARPPQFVNPALLGAAEKVWHWKELAKGELLEPEVCNPTEVAREPSVQNTGPSGPPSAKCKSQRTSGSVLVENSAIKNSTSIVSSGFTSKHKSSDLQQKNSGNSAVSQVAVVSSQPNNLHLQNEEERVSMKRDCNTVVQTFALDSRSQSSSLSSYEGAYGPSLLQNAGPNGSPSSKCKTQRKSGHVLVENSVIYNSPSVISSGFASPQKSSDLQRKNSGNSALSAMSDSTRVAVFSSQFDNLQLQSEEERESIKRNFNTAVQNFILDSRSESSSLSSYEYGPHFGGGHGHVAPDAKITQSAMNSSSDKLQPHFGAAASMKSMHTQVSSLPSQNSNNGHGNMGREQNSMAASACYPVEFSPAPATLNSHIPVGMMPDLPVKYSPSDMSGTCPPLFTFADPRGATIQKHTVASSSPSLQSHSRGNLHQVGSHDASLGIIYKAMTILEQDMLAPTEDNIRDCMQYWELQYENFDLKQTLSRAVQLQHIFVKKIGRGLVMYYPPNNRHPWHCIDPGNMQCEYPLVFWSELHQFLLYGEQRFHFRMSRNRYDAAQILRKSGANHMGNLAIGKIILLLQQAIQLKKWIKLGKTGWSPLSPEEGVLLDYSPGRP